MRKRPLFFIFLGLCAGIWLSEAFHIPFLFKKIYPANHIKNFTPKNPAQAYITAVIVTEPAHAKTSYGSAKITFAARVFTLGRIDGLYPEKSAASVSGLCNVVSFNERDLKLEYGDCCLIKGRLSRPWALSNPGCFNRRQYLNRQGIYSLVSVKKADFIEVLSKDKANYFVRRIFLLKRKMSALIDKYLPSTEAGVLKGILLGERFGVEDSLKDKFIRTGTVHILAISGLHVGLIASLFVLILRFLRLPRYLVYIGASGLLIFYAVLTGASIPVTRATIMAIAMLIGLAAGRNTDMLNCLGLSGIIILFNNPQALFDAGFELSYATVVSIIVLAPKLEKVLLGADNKDCIVVWRQGLRDRLKRYLAGSVAVSFSAWIGIIPIIAYHFNIISPICILANIPVVFLFASVVAAELAFLVTGLLPHFLTELFGLALGSLTGILIKIVSLFSYVPFGSFLTARWNAFETTGFYAVVFIFAAGLYYKRMRKAYAIAAALIFFNMIIWQGNLKRPADFFSVTVLDTGHADAIVLEFPRGGCALIDAGKKDDNMDTGQDIITPYLLSRRISRIDAMFITHPDDDHYGGAAAVLRNFKVSNIFDNNDATAGSINFLAYQKLIKKKRIPRRPLSAGDIVEGFKGTKILTLNPGKTAFAGADSRNNNSLVLNVKRPGHSFLFCADIEEEAMQKLIQYKNDIKADYIKIAHHGSKISAIGEVFLEAVAPKTALISADYNDVSDSLLSALARLGCSVYTTYDDGAIILAEDKDRGMRSGGLVRPGRDRSKHQGG